MDLEPILPAKFGKSRLNRGTERSGIDLLLGDPRFQRVDSRTKKEILRLLPVQGDFGIHTFDLVMTSKPAEPIDVTNVARHVDDLTLVEMKTTKKATANAALNGFFFGATEREYAMAAALGNHYQFAFVVLNRNNDFGQEFAVLLPLSEVENRTRQKRIQFQVNFLGDLPPETEPVGLVLLGINPATESEG